MSLTVTNSVLRDLASFRSSGGGALSMYLNLDPSVAPTPSDVDTRFRARLSEAEKAGEGGDAERITSWWENDFDRDGVQGLAVFSSTADNFFLVVPLPTPVEDAVYVGDDLLISPLVGDAGEVETFVAVVSREQGRVYSLRGGRLEEVIDESEEQPGQHTQGGWAQARYQRHIDNLVQQHLKTVGEAIEKRARGVSQLQLVVVAAEEMRSDFASALSQDASESIVGWASAEAHAGPADLLEVVRPVLDEADARRVQEALERYEEELGRGARASAGWQPTLDAAADTRVELLLVTQGANRAVYQCPECRRAFVDDGTCPIDDLALVKKEDGVDIAIRHTLANGGQAVKVGSGALGDEEIGALLRY
ncbi:MAG TPA: Vms1/Ankzf1 family peptidyl-tRNA hydrolase [Gaiellaceae bacterium]|nr:Vms1/Ankzf1 family peptidyl-tRNA hydrolase [Gaiellaceae bacterium]